MTDILLETAVFGAKALIVVVSALCVMFAAAVLARRGGRDEPADRGRVVVTDLGRRYRAMADAVRRTLLDDKEWKALTKRRKKEAAEADGRPTVFVLDFDGDIAANGVGALRRLVTTVLQIAMGEDEVVVRLRSPGGLVPGYGLAASQLSRLREAEIPVTVCVDVVAASGGYMMAVVSDRLLAAPFAIIGSIGVFVPVPNIHRLLREHGVDYDEITSGRYMRTVGLLGEITDEGRQKTQEQADETHQLFKDHVALHRPDLDIDSVATGEFWYGTQALALGLVDEVSTSDDHLVRRVEDARLLHLRYERADNLARRVLGWWSRASALRGALPRLPRAS